MSDQQLLSEHGMDLAYKAIDYAAENIQSTKESFTPFGFFLTKDGKSGLKRFASNAPDDVSRMAQAAIDELSDQLVAYAIAQDGFTTFDGEKRDSIIIEAGCGISGKGINLIQQYSIDPEYQEHGNVKLAGETEFRITISSAARSKTEQLIQPLCKAPFAIFREIAAADGNIDEKEMNAFVATLGEGLKSANPLVAACIQHCVNNAPEYFAMVQTDQLDLEREIFETKKVIASEFQQANGEEYLDFLKLLATKIAQPKGGFLGFGKKVVTEDADAIKKVESLLA